MKKYIFKKHDISCGVSKCYKQGCPDIKKLTLFQFQYSSTSFKTIFSKPFLGEFLHPTMWNFWLTLLFLEGIAANPVIEQWGQIYLRKMNLHVRAIYRSCSYYYFLTISLYLFSLLLCDQIRPSIGYTKHPTYAYINPTMETGCSRFPLSSSVGP